MISAARKAHRVLMVAYCMRYDPLVIRMKELLDRKTYGECFQVSIWTEQYTYSPVKVKAAFLGGGQFFSHGCHYVDILLWYLGAPVRGVHMGTNLGTPWMEKEGTSNMIMEFEGGKMAYHFGTWGARGSRLKYSFHAHCTEAMIDLDISNGKLFVRKWDEEKKLLMSQEFSKPTQEELRHFLDCIDTGQRPETDGPRSLQSLRAIWRMYEAEQRGKVADLAGLGLDNVNLEGILK
jgi:predicted dehydrogenase